MKKLLLMGSVVLLLAGCSFEVRDADPDQEDGFKIDWIDNREDEDEDKDEDEK